MSNATRLSALTLCLLALGLGAVLPAFAEEGECSRVDMEVHCLMSSRVVLVGDPFTVTATVRNTGDVELAEVLLVIAGREGIQHVGGELKLTIEKLDPGEMRQLSATFVSNTPGEWRVDASAREKRNWAAAGCWCGLIIKGLPALQLEMIDVDIKRERKGIFEVGEEFIYQLTVENDAGTALTPELKVVWQLPPQLEFVRGVGERGATVSGAGQTAESSAFPLRPDQQQAFELVVKVIGVPDRNLVQTRASVVTTAGGQELATETESTTLKNQAPAR
jgi:hypothetical protein